MPVSSDNKHQIFVGKSSMTISRAGLLPDKKAFLSIKDYLWQLEIIPMLGMVKLGLVTQLDDGVIQAF